MTRAFTRMRWPMRQREQVVDDFEPLLIFRIVDRTDVGDMVEGGLRRIVQIAGDLHNRWCGHMRRSVPSVPCRRSTDRTASGKLSSDCRSELACRSSKLTGRNWRSTPAGLLRSRFYFTNTFSRWIFSCSFKSPSSNASGRGGQPGHIHVDRNNLVDTLDHGVTVVVIA